MAARAFSWGHEIRHEGGRWVYDDTGEPVDDLRPRYCVRCGRLPVIAMVPDTERLAIAGHVVMVPRYIDACLVDLVRALNAAGIYTEKACCGHGKHPGWIGLADGRRLELRQ